MKKRTSNPFSKHTSYKSYKPKESKHPLLDSDGKTDRPVIMLTIQSRIGTPEFEKKLEEHRKLSRSGEVQVLVLDDKGYYDLKTGDRL